MINLCFVLSLGFFLDLLFGDPYWLPHPIRLIGLLISHSEKFLRKRIKSEWVGGLLLTIFVVTVSFAVPWVILYVTWRIHPILSMAIQIFFCYQILATKSLKTESMKVYHALKKNDLEDARLKVSYIVGRDTQNLDATQIAKAAIETVAENTCDGIIAPLIYMAIGGAPLGFVYKAVNTLDSMVGYKNDTYILFGKASARLDDIVNYIPARFSAWVMLLAGLILGYDFKNGCKIYKRDKKNHASPNSAQTESVCAGLFNIQLAGDAYYFGKLSKKPFIGDANRPVNTEDIKKANRLLYMTAFLSLGILLCIVRNAIRLNPL